MDFALQEISVMAYIIHNKSEDYYTIYTLEDGGPIVTAGTEDQAREEFETAFRLSVAVKNFLFFKAANRADSPEEKLKFIQGLKERVSFEYNKDLTA